MITFAQFLEESSRSFPLYHGISDAYNALKVLQSGELQPLTHHTGEKLLLNKGKDYRGISTTRSIDFAKQWSLTYASSFGIILELNHKAIDDNYRIIPINYFSSINPSARTKDGFGVGYATTRGTVHLDKFKKVNNEYEEFIVTNRPIPLNDKYLTTIHVSKARYERFGDNVEGFKEALDKYKNKVKFY